MEKYAHLDIDQLSTAIYEAAFNSGPRQFEDYTITDKDIQWVFDTLEIEKAPNHCDPTDRPIIEDTRWYTCRHRADIIKYSEW